MTVISGDTVGSGQTLDVISPNSAIDTKVVSGGKVLVHNGGVAVSTFIGSRGTVAVYSGGRESAGTISRGTEVIISGGVAVGDSLTEGAEMVSSGGSAIDTTVEVDGYLRLSGGTTTGTLLDSGGEEFVGSGSRANSTTVASGGAMYLSAYGVTRVMQVESGGLIYADTSGTVVSATIQSGGEQFQAGLAMDTVIEVRRTCHRRWRPRPSWSGQRHDGGTRWRRNSVRVCERHRHDGRSGGLQVVFSGGVAIDTTVQSGGKILLIPGGKVDAPNLHAGGSIVSTGILLVDTSSGVTLEGNVVSGAAIALTATEYVLAKGSNVSVTVFGSAVIYSGGIDSYGVVSSGGVEILSGGLASGVTVNEGTQIVSSGGFSFETTVTGEESAPIYYALGAQAVGPAGSRVQPGSMLRAPKA